MSLVHAAYLRLLRPLLLVDARSSEATARALRAARIGVFPEWYLSLSLLAASGAAAAALVAASAWLLAAGTGPAWARALLALGAGAAVFALARLAFLAYPRLRAAGRARRIEAEFPSVAILVYALARGGVNPLEAFRAVARQRGTFGEISLEFGLVLREVEWFGEDLVAALQSVARTTPSASLRGYFDGLVSILGSGADPGDYFRRQAEAQTAGGELRMQRDLEQAGLLAEAYVSGLLVLPLLLIVILSVLSALNGGGAGYLPLLVFGLIPVGTLAYLLLVEILLPPETLGAPPEGADEVADFGIEALRPAGLLLPPPRPRALREVREEAAARAGEAGLRRRLLAEWARQRARAAWRAFVLRALVKPVEAIEVSGTLALLLLLAGGVAVWVGGARGASLVVAGTGVLLASALVAAVPVSAFHEVRVRRARRVASALPETLARLASFNERGIGLLQAFRLLGRDASGPLGRALRGLDRDVAWTGSLAAALRRLRDRVGTRAMARLAVLLEQAGRASGDLKDVLDVAAHDAARAEALHRRRRQSMASYVVVIYVVFAVFLYVLAMVAGLFHGETGLALAAGSPGAPEPAGDPSAARVGFFHAALIQGVCCGVVAGKLGEGHLLSGLKHAALLAAVAWAVFSLGVLA